ncbi:MAG: cobalamin-dependent protein [bacterium]
MTQVPLERLSPAALQRFAGLRVQAVEAVTNRFYQDHASLYASFGDRGREACREDLGFHLEFLRPVLEFGEAAPMVDYLRWLAGVLTVRNVPVEHLAQSLDWLAEFFSGHLPPEDGAIVAAALSRARDGLLADDGSSSGANTKLPEAWAECVEFELALLTGDRTAATAAVSERMARGHSLIDTELHMIQPALYQIGRKWEQNLVSVAQEHLATAIAQSLMMQELVRCEPSQPNGRKVVLACVAGNHHDVGLQMVADAFQLSGWEVSYLGADVPTGSLIQYVGSWKPDLVGLSIAFAQQLAAGRTVVSRIADEFGDQRPRVIIGGLAINNFEGLAGQIGADGWGADSASAIAAAARVASPPVKS